MSQSAAGRRRACPCRDASMTVWEQTWRTVRSAATTGWSKVRTSASLMPMSRTCAGGIGPSPRSASFSEPAGHSSITR